LTSQRSMRFKYNNLDYVNDGVFDRISYSCMNNKL
jgi:hypothetical protein